MKTKSIFSILSVALVGYASAQVATEPVGFVSFEVPAGSDKTVGLPLHRPASLETVVDSVTGDQIGLGSNVTLAADQFVFSAGVQNDHFYVRVIDTVSPSSAVLGRWYEVVDNSGGASPTVDLSDPDLSTTIEAQGLAAGDTIQIIPFWTLDTLFPQGEGIDTTTDFNSLQGIVLLQAQETTGTNLAAGSQHIYWTGAQGLADGWYNIGNGQPSGVVHIAPDTFLALRNPGSGKTVSVVGSVPGAKAINTSLVTLAADEAQDNMVSNSFPIPLTLQQLQIFESGAFTSSTDFNDLQDQLLLFPETPSGTNVSPSATLIYWTGAQGLVDGWYNIGNGQGPLDATQVIGAGEAFIVRKTGTPGSGVASSWKVTTPYSVD